MVQFSFPTSVFEHFELQVARADSDNVSLCPKNGEFSPSFCSSPINTEQIRDGFINISSCNKNGQEVWQISLAGLPASGTPAPFHEPMSHSTMNQNVDEGPLGQSTYPIDYSTTPNSAMVDWTAWKMPDLLGSMGGPSIDVAPSQLSSPGGSLSNLQQLSNALSQHALDSPPYMMNGHPLLGPRDFPPTVSTQKDVFLQSNISSPSNQSSFSDSGISDDDDPNTASSSPTSSFPCVDPSCRKTFKRVHARNNHVKRRHATLRNSSNAHTAPSSQVVHRCTVSECGEQFTRRHDRMRHEWSQHSIRSDFSCSHCHRLFSSQNRLDRHYAEKHPTITR